jgi:hypothetical protein
VTAKSRRALCRTLAVHREGSCAMEPIVKGQLKSVIASAYVLRLDTGETQMLITKGESYCHFFEPITIEDYKIVFRIDWSDLDTSLISRQNYNEERWIYLKLISL